MSLRRSSSSAKSRRPATGFRPDAPPSDRSAARRVLKERDIQPSYGMGQNFLMDRGISAWIVEQLQVRKEDTVIEIGPGMGALTEHLVETPARRIVLVEKDDRLAEMMREKFGNLPQVTVLHEDAVRLDMRPFFRDQPVKILGALPYSCGTEIIRNVMHNPSPAHRAIFTLQKEVCERLAAKPGDSHYGLLTLRTQTRWEVEFLRKLPPEIFMPCPTVDSGVIAMTPRPRAELPVFDEKLYDRMLTSGFSQRRKMLKNLLPPNPNPEQEWEVMSKALGVNPMARAQELTLRQWVDLTNLYDRHELKDNPQSGEEIFDVVDGENRVIRQESRRIVHHDNLWHRAVHIFVLSREGEVFLQKRSHLKDKMPEKWDSSAAGHLDAGEDYLPAAVRELAEELGIRTEAGALTLAGRVPACAGTGWEFVELFTLPWEGKLRWPASEIETGAWFTPVEIDAWTAARPQDFAEGFLECWSVHRGQGK